VNLLESYRVNASAARRFPLLLCRIGNTT
jgi:hypothetical protein